MLILRLIILSLFTGEKWIKYFTTYWNNTSCWAWVHRHIDSPCSCWTIRSCHWCSVSCEFPGALLRASAHQLKAYICFPPSITSRPISGSSDNGPFCTALPLALLALVLSAPCIFIVHSQRSFFKRLGGNCPLRS